MKAKQILFTAPREVSLVDTEVGEVQSGCVLVKMLYTAISAGTEKANLLGEDCVSPSIGSVVPFPRGLGYSGTGIVEKVGEGVCGIRAGDRVATSWGVHKSYCLFPQKNVMVLDEDISLKQATLTHVATFPLAAIRKTRLEVGESAIVMGLGTLGILAVKLLKLSGAVPIIAVDLDENKRNAALKMGADFALDSRDKDFAQKVKVITGGGARVAIEVTGVGKALDEVLDCMARFGRVALLGCTRKSDFTIDYYRKVHAPGITLVGAHTNARPEFESSPGYWTQNDDKAAFLKLLKYKRISLDDMISEIHSPNDAVEVYNRLATQSSFPYGVLFDWSQL